MGSRNHEKRRQAAISAVQSGSIAAADAYGTMDGSGSLTRGMLEPYEAEARAAGTGIWSSLGSQQKTDAQATIPRLQQKAAANAPRVTGYGAVKFQPTIERTPNRASGTGAPALPLAARAPSASQPTIARGGFNLQAVGSAGGRMGAMPAAPAAASSPTITRTPTYGAFGGQNAVQYSTASTPSAAGTGAPASTASGPMDATRKKALEDELAELWSNMGWSQGTAAYQGYKQRADAIEQELVAAQKAAQAPAPAPGAFGSGVTSAGRPASYNATPAQQMQTPAKVGERRPNPYGGEDVVWSGTSWDSATEWAAKQAKAAQPPMPTIERQKPATQQPPATTRTDYVPPTESRFESTPGFDQQDYSTAYVNSQIGQVNNAYAETIRRKREDYAARGLSQAGRSGAEQQELVMAEIARSNAAGQVGADATKTAMELGRTDAIERARNIDSYGISRGNFGINMARDNRDATREDSMLPLDTQIKVLEAAGINLRNAGIQLANDGSVIQNDHNRAIVDFYKQTRNIDMTRMQQGATLGDLEIQRGTTQNDILSRTANDVVAQASISRQMADIGLQVAQQEARMANETFEQRLAAKKAELSSAIAQGRLSQWESENAHWLAVLKFFGNLGTEVVKSAVGSTPGK